MVKAVKIKETDLYPPIKNFLEGQGYEVKAEIGAADIVALRGEEPPLIVEMKTGFSLALFHQAIERLAMTDLVYISVPRGSGKPFLKSLKGNIALCRRLGLGLLTVRMKDGFVEAHLDPSPYRPRKSKIKQSRLLREFSRRVGDPNLGGSTRRTLMTAYRQDALRCLAYLKREGPTKAALVAKSCDVNTARRIMADDHYGWFERVDKGIYAITPKGLEGAEEYAKEIAAIEAAQKPVKKAKA